MSDKDATLPYEVGHCRPPVATRFKPGRSGNPSGKKRSASIRALFVKAALAKPVRRHAFDNSAEYATHLDAMFARFLDSAAHGNDKATACVLALCDAYLGEVDLPAGPPADVAEPQAASPCSAREIG